MTNKENNTGLPVEKKKPAEIKAKFVELGALLVALLTIAVWFLAILLIAAGLGWVLHWLQANALWMPTWMFQVGHFIEGFLFVADCVSLVFAVFKELWSHVLAPVFLLGRKVLGLDSNESGQEKEA